MKVSMVVCMAVIQISPNCKIKIIQCYPPTSKHTDEEIEVFHEIIGNAINKNATTHTFVIGDFSAKLGKRQDSVEYVGDYSFDERNERGTRMLEFLTCHHLYSINYFYHKKKSSLGLAPMEKLRTEVIIFAPAVKR